MTMGLWVNGKEVNGKQALPSIDLAISLPLELRPSGTPRHSSTRKSDSTIGNWPLLFYLGKKNQPCHTTKLRIRRSDPYTQEISLKTPWWRRIYPITAFEREALFFKTFQSFPVDMTLQICGSTLARERWRWAGAKIGLQRHALVHKWAGSSWKLVYETWLEQNRLAYSDCGVSKVSSPWIPPP